jgi:hypothetical protein
MRAATLPARFPAGTRYVIESRPGKAGEVNIISRHIIMPNGDRIDLNKTRSFDRPRGKAAKSKPGRRKG